MNIPKLRQQKTIKKYHGISWQDNYAWIHQKNILKVLKDPTTLNPEIRKYLEENNNYTEYHLKDTKKFQKKLFDEIKGRIKLDDETLPYTDKKYIYWAKTTKKTNYAINLRKKIGSNKIEEYWSGEKEKKRLNAEYFGIGDLEVSHNDEMLAYSLDLKGSEYFTIYVRRISDNKIVSEEIKETSGSVTWSLDDKYIFYSKLDKHHRPRRIYRHKIGTRTKKDKLIYEEKDEGFTCGIGISSDEKYFFVATSDLTTSEIYFFNVNEDNPKLKLFRKRQKEIKYSVDSWKGNFYIHTNLDAEDYKICKCKHENIKKWEDFIPATKGVLIGNFDLLNEWMIRSELRDALSKLYVRNLNTNKEEDLVIADERSEAALFRILKDKMGYEWTSKFYSKLNKTSIDERLNALEKLSIKFPDILWVLSTREKMLRSYKKKQSPAEIVWDILKHLKDAPEIQHLRKNYRY